jgi:hypothetical protein
VQHLVSAERGEYSGTLGVLARLVESMNEAGVGHTRLTFRPTNPGASRLLGGLVDQLPQRLVAHSAVDYGFAPVRAVVLRCGSAVTVHDELDPTELYARVLHPVELASLRLDDPTLESLDRSYGANGLTRSRSVLTAVLGGRIVGACLVNHASEGINFSFLENAIEYVRVAPELRERRCRDVWRALLHAAVELVGRRRDYVVVALSPADRELAVAAGVIASAPKRYAVVTVSAQGFERAFGCFEGYYRERVAAA